MNVELITTITNDGSHHYTLANVLQGKQYEVSLTTSDRFGYRLFLLKDNGNKQILTGMIVFVPGITQRYRFNMVSDGELCLENMSLEDNWTLDSISIKEM